MQSRRIKIRDREIGEGCPCYIIAEMSANHAGDFSRAIEIIHVAKEGLNFLDNPHEGEALQYLFEISKSVGADLSVLKSDNVVKCIADFAKEKNIDCIILGESPADADNSRFYTKLRNVLDPRINIKVIPQ